MKAGIDELRAAVNVLNQCNESFNQRFTAEQLLALCRAHAASSWDIPPDEWTTGQVHAALRGVAPDWDRNEKPVKSTRVLDTAIEALDRAAKAGKR